MPARVEARPNVLHLEVAPHQQASSDQQELRTRDLHNNKDVPEPGPRFAAGRLAFEYRRQKETPLIVPDSFETRGSRPQVEALRTATGAVATISGTVPMVRFVHHGGSLVTTRP